jgi:hypothetical protein
MSLAIRAVPVDVKMKAPGGGKFGIVKEDVQFRPKAVAEEVNDYKELNSISFKRSLQRLTSHYKS